MSASKKHARSTSTDDVLKHPSTKRAKEIDQTTPYDTLTDLLPIEPKPNTKKKNAILHWFRSKDLRMQDNKALHAASQKASETQGAHLIALYLWSPKDILWHGTSPARVDFLLESLRLLQKELEREKGIPLHIITAEERGEKTAKVVEFVKGNGIGEVFANFEYEVDELRRDISVAKALEEEGVGFGLWHDQTVVEPGSLVTGSGGPHKVFTPYHKAWLAETKDSSELLDVVPEPEGNDKAAKEELKGLFGSAIPEAPTEKAFTSKEERERIRKLWPAGHQAGMQRLEDFLDKKVKHYATHRSEPARDPSSRLSPYFASGIIGLRETLARTLQANSNQHFDAGDPGIASWVREIVFREFYRHIMLIIPHNSLNLPQNLKFDFVHWETDEEGYKKWEEGKTGVPFIDAGMRQLNHEAYMHNRLRMNVSSYLRANLLIDYRRGERYFAEKLIDWDLCNNTQGWEPSYTIFNPVVQAEKCDKEGEYIRKWVPELKDVRGKAVFDPYHRLERKEFEKLGYPAPHVDFGETSRRAKERYKHDLAEADP
ncbi:Deoxyribodipyrimidine photo-lyase [Lecanosticta acicola]|uniref:Deoxyribodipyrimidine photo-lyase n=1 Tax=Lecanosticta acicola TaxID=111012 RepID=A0AAI8YRJ6_9PEZI|nr:Deoxyribodipyrimidine photo-lyase [Lecanosticta acicola]